MHTRRTTRPIKMISLTAIGGTAQTAVTSEFMPLAERWRRTGERLAHIRQAVVGFAGLLWRGLLATAQTLGRLVADGIRWVRPRAAFAVTSTYRSTRAGTRGLVRTVRRLRGRVRRVRRQRALAPAGRSNHDVIETMEQLRWEVQLLRAQIQTQQEILIQLASHRSDRDTDVAWVARIVASARQLRDDSKPDEPGSTGSAYYRPALSQLGSLQRLSE